VRLTEFPVRRPVAVAMLFFGMVLLGVVGWVRLPVELLPALEGNELLVFFARPGSEPEVVERELLIPLEGRVAELEDVAETWGEITGSSGQLRVRFEPDADVSVRQLELQRIATQLVRGQPRGTTMEVSAQDFSAISRFVMVVHVSGGSDRNALRDLVEERIVPRVGAVPGVSQAIVTGGAPREVTVRLDPDRCAAEGVTPSQVAQRVAAAVSRLEYLGGAEDESGRTAVLLDARPRGVLSLGELRIFPDRPLLLRHVAKVEQGVGREDVAFRVNGRPTVGLIVFQEQGANLVRLGGDLRTRLDEMEAELAPYGIDFSVGFDAAETVEDQLGRLKRLALSGFVIALVVLFLFLRELRAVAVVAVAVPVSLLAAVALLHMAGLTLNLITLFGLAVGIGMLVDNSIVVFESIERLMGRGVPPMEAAAAGVGRTVRAILAASVTNAVVFLPIAFSTDDALLRGTLIVLAAALLLPLAASVVVALGLVPLLARWLAAPAARRRLEALRRRRERWMGLIRPDRGRELFSGVLMVGLRHPASWLSSVAAAVLLTVVIAVPWVAVSTASQAAREADEVRISLEVSRAGSLEGAGDLFSRVEGAVMDLPGIERVESVYQEEGGTLTVHLVDADERPPDISVARVRSAVDRAVQGLDGIQVQRLSSSGGGTDGGGMAALFGGGSEEVVISGPDARVLQDLAGSLEQRLEAVPEVQEAGTTARAALNELRVTPEARILDGLGLTADQVLPSLSVVRREGVQLQVGFVLADGRELPLVVRSVEPESEDAIDEIRDLRLATSVGELPLDAVASIRVMPAQPTIQHHDGRRESRVTYSLRDDAPTTGPARNALDERIREAVREVHRPSGTTVETEAEERALSWFRRVLVPVLLLLFATLAITFESLTLPILVLVAVPLTLLGATWALVFTGTPADLMALVGAVALLGLTVNPAILLVDRMQARVRSGAWTAGAAALSAVRERARPVLMTSATTIAGLWPLSLSSGREMEIWPPFATVVMGGLATSTLLTLLVIPMGFVILERLDRIFGRLGPWVVLVWAAATAAVITPLVMTGLLTTTTWQLLTTLLVAGVLLGVAVVVLRTEKGVEPVFHEGRPPVLDVRFLRKVYGRPGPVGRALRSGRDFAERVLAKGGEPFDRREAGSRAVTTAVMVAGVGLLALQLESAFWRVLAVLLASGLAAAALREFRRARGRVDERGVVLRGGIENLLAMVAPWFGLGLLAWSDWLVPTLAESPRRQTGFGLVVTAILVLVVQGGRASARAQSEGRMVAVPGSGFVRRPRALWRAAARTLFGLDLPREEVEAVATVSFRATGGMVGVLGPNGAGKTTLLRMLAGILDPSLGVMTLGGAPIPAIRRRLARWLGYLPQEFGLPHDLTAREYLEYFAILYGVGRGAALRERVDHLLGEVGLAERADEKIGGFSGGMRQRVAVARTLLRLPSVIIVDEPTVGLDPRERIRFRNLLSRLARGRVVLFSTHVVEDVAVACDRVLVMRGGEIVYDGEPAELAATAAGRVWQVRLPDVEADALESGARVVDRVPEGAVDRLRLIADHRPHRAAEPVEPTLEDAYLVLMTEGRGQ
jgi:multidrug efflux pump subunit AcrB/ABC-type multidrug transport system ATPase subunit